MMNQGTRRNRSPVMSGDFYSLIKFLARSSSLLLNKLFWYQTLVGLSRTSITPFSICLPPRLFSLSTSTYKNMSYYVFLALCVPSSLMNFRYNMGDPKQSRVESKVLSQVILLRVIVAVVKKKKPLKSEPPIRQNPHKKNSIRNN